MEDFVMEDSVKSLKHEKGRNLESKCGVAFDRRTYILLLKWGKNGEDGYRFWFSCRFGIWRMTKVLPSSFSVKLLKES